MELIYLDNAATTPILPSVRQAMEPYMQDVFGNPSSVHQAGRRAKAAIEKAREQVAKAIGAKATEIVFTSGGTESDNAALISMALSLQEKGKHLVTTSIEHHAVLHTCAFLEQLGFEITYVDPNEQGIVTLAAIEQALRDDTILVSVMMVNNETGAIQPIAEIGALTAERGIAFHTDAVQAVGLLPVDVAALQVDLLSMSGHKLHAPKGVGALFVHGKTKWTPYLHGGNQERQRRAGTENVASIVGFGAAIELAAQDRESKLAHIRDLRDTMLGIFRSELDHVVLNSPEDALPSILNVTFTGVSAESLLMNLDMMGIAASSGSACTSGSLQPSHVLMAMGLSEEHVKSAIRFSFSGHNTRDEVTEAANKIVQVVKRLRK
jgi:cysteine desulfurase